MGIRAGVFYPIAEEVIGNYNLEAEWTVNTDSRKPVPDSLFFPIVGERFDGHDHLLEAIHNGAKAAFWQKDVPVPQALPDDFPLFMVEDTLKALQESAKHYLKLTHPIVIGVTGSNGKTTTKDLVEAVLTQKFRTHKTQGNFNNHIGLPLTILSMPKDTEALILEMGMNHFGEIDVLTRIANPDFAIITNIGESHIEYLGSREGIAKAKLEILNGLKPDGVFICDGDEPLLTQAATNQRSIRVGYSETCTAHISSVQLNSKGSEFVFDGHLYHVPLYGKHNIKNAAYALALAEQLQISPAQCQTALAHLTITAMRFEVTAGPKGTMIINDAYNASPTSMIASLETLKELSGFEKVVAVLGDMYELGPDEEALHRKVADCLAAPITDVVTIGPKARWIADELKKRPSSVQIHEYQMKEDAIPLLLSFLGEKTVMLFKASRGMKLETLIQDLQREGGISK
ncbi:UDP-N-acetylmuramoyl-tripeptide--D-alanyl-D-alanine ligase [Pullulanibacillus sp. KACC 23026]|uniref:UDP-N-acetylmuramoyl-tripeptide--D-alanyl-D- alanine ligase n=1 Tax=Pullulanibacillus sp. KACC 23026 TaxID=3028315 RepID=UPI0023B0DFD1|nr:UDP-N-acetylmuramoyl-tripeptide--D-alanyl-D-alanine ligase [Pullulanibacillus sp. KACC 23026]WEG11665.1 UDP-N-acetylmuramoyl-tripeptide--D-alanyl-D-alanine ligase [Pullulanibacillus sp. KACC 23026]